jgi:AcrR family transcriptional regulator
MEHTSTEEKILQAATEVFIMKGYDGSTMQEIANRASINKSLLHYYYRSKDKLFTKVFSMVFHHLFIPKVIKIFESDMSLFEKIEAFTEQYIDVILKNPYIPMFVMRELTNNPNRLAGFAKQLGLNPEKAYQSIQKEIEKGNIRETEPRQLMVNIIALCIFPFAGKPMLKAILFDNDEEHYHAFLKQRKTEVSRFIINSIRVS